MASRSNPLLSSILRQLRTQPQRAAIFRPPLRQPRAHLPQPFIANAVSIRSQHTIPPPPSPAEAKAKSKNPETNAKKPKESPRPPPRADYYQLSFTCLPCGHRSHHNVSKQGYHHGSTLIACPSCRNRHVISDHLNIFGDKPVTIEDLMREKGQLVKRGTLGEDGDIEFWPDEAYGEKMKSPGTSNNE